MFLLMISFKVYHAARCLRDNSIGKIIVFGLLKRVEDFVVVIGNKIINAV